MRLKRASFLVVCGSVLLLSLSCGHGNPPIPAKPLVITTTSLPAAVINVPYSQTLTLTGGVGPYTWSLASGSLPTGLSISSAGTISGTPTALGSVAFKVQVTDSQTPKQAVATSSETIAVNGALAISTTSPLTSGSVGVPYTASLQATGGVPPYTWTLTSGVLPVGLSLSTSGVISGTPTNQETQTFTVQVADSQSPASTASVTLTLTITGPTGRLSGNYVFSFRGYAAGGLQVRIGSFTADGQGNITNGLMDFGGGGPSSVPFTGSYSIGPTNTGSMTFVVPSLSQVFSNQVAVPASGTIRFIQNGQAGGQGTGTIRKVTPTTKITLANLAAFWTYGATGADSASARYATAGTFQASATGAWSNLEFDANDNGSFTHNTTASGNFTSIDPVTQRGTATMTVNGVTTNYSFYPVSANELLMVSLDPVSATAPLALFDLQTRFSNNLSNSSIAIPTVTELQGLGSSNGNTVPYGLLAIASFDGKGAVSITTDENLNGVMTANKYSAATYSVAANGRTTVTGFGSNPVVFYLAQTVAFTLEGDAGVTAGTILPQQGSSFTNASIIGSYQGATLEAVLPSVTVQDDSAAADGNGNIALTYDTSGPGGPQQGLTQAITYSVDNTGRAPLQVNGNTVGIAYVVTSTTSGATTGKVLVLSTDTNANINDLEQ